MLIVHKGGLNIIWGDFNINKDQPGNKVFYKDFIDLVESYNFKQTVNKPTHERNGVLDLIFLPSDLFVNEVIVFNRETGVEISDHFPIKLELPFVGEKTQDFHEIKYRNFKSINLQSLKDDLYSTLSHKLTQFTNHENNLNNITNSILQILSNKFFQVCLQTKLTVMHLW